jgi:hypothetical protein
MPVSAPVTRPTERSHGEDRTICRPARFVVMDASDLLPHRTALIGAGVALVIGLAGGVALKVGNQSAPEPDFAYAGELSGPEAQPIAWPAGKVPDYVVGTDFLRAQEPPPAVVVATYEVPEYVPATWTEPEPQPQSQPQPVRMAEANERSWASTGGDILDVRLPEDPPAPPEPPPTVEAPDAPTPSAPITLAAFN